MNDELRQFRLDQRYARFGMELWIDNTGLHGAGRCLLGEAKTPYDFKGFLQLATLIVFADTIQLNEFEPPEIVQSSAQFRDQILDIGLEGAALGIHRTSREEYATACDSAAEFLGDELVYRFRTDEQQLLGIPISNLPRGAQFYPEQTEWLASQVDDTQETEAVREKALDEKARGATDFMLAGSVKLRQAVRRLMSEADDWSPAHTFQIEAVLRAYLNLHLGRQVGAAYAPAAHRADLVTRQNQWVLDKLGNALDPIVNELRPEPLGIPSVHEALIRKSKGDPKGLILEALHMRERAASLRPLLRALQREEVEGGPAGQLEVRNEIVSLASGVRHDLGLSGTAIWDAIKINPMTGLPAPISVKTLLDWLKLRLAKQSRVVLTDVVTTAAYSGVNDAVYRKLVDRCFGGTVSIGSSQVPRLR